MAYYLDGRVSALWGTHTHVPTADERVFPKGTGYHHGPGHDRRGGVGAGHRARSSRWRPSWAACRAAIARRRGPARLQGAMFTLDSATGLCTAVERVDIRDQNTEEETVSCLMEKVTGLSGAFRRCADRIREFRCVQRHGGAGRRGRGRGARPHCQDPELQAGRCSHSGGGRRRRQDRQQQV